MQPVHPFDRYAPFTDVAALKAISERPLRKSVRVNELKMTIEEFRAYAEGCGWSFMPIPWCPEGFFIDREDREEGLGKDLLHLTGHFYMQEAASMLPVSLLDPKPGEIVLDMSAAPGSKTTQIASRMRGRGVIVANDVQEKRLWTLKSALYRSGVTNAIVVKKVGQWYAKHMTERFDRVLCDAPCTAQGTARKDSDALRYASMENIEKMARLQVQLLESAIHAAKVGGTIVYSTCTLTPEENEQIIATIVNKFSDHVEVVDPRTVVPGASAAFEKAIEDSRTVQGSTEIRTAAPLLRLWPQTLDTEGFFSAALRKTARTKEPTPMDTVRFEERELPKAKRKEIAESLQKMYGISFVEEHERLFERGEHVLLANEETAWLDLPVRDYSLGLPFGKRLTDGRVLLAHEIVTLRGRHATSHVLDLTSSDVDDLLRGKDIECDPSLRGHMILRANGRAFGLSLAKDGRLKNNLPRWMVGVRAAE